MPLIPKQQPPYYTPATSEGQTKTYKGLLTQVGTAAPTIQILQNTIGPIVWTYIDVGIYQGTLANAFTTNKTTINVYPVGYYGTGGIPHTVNSIQITCNQPDGSATNDVFLNNGFEINVYP